MTHPQRNDLTQPQRDVLAWLVATGWDRFGGSSLEAYYDEKRRREDPSITFGPSLGTCRAWWRTGGAMLARLNKKGLLVCHGRYDAHSPEYSLTAEGRKAARS